MARKAATKGTSTAAEKRAAKAAEKRAEKEAAKAEEENAAKEAQQNESKDAQGPGVDQGAERTEPGPPPVPAKPKPDTARAPQLENPPLTELNRQSRARAATMQANEDKVTRAISDAARSAIRGTKPVRPPR